MSAIIKINNPYQRWKRKNLPIVSGQSLAEIRCRSDVIDTIRSDTDAVIAINGHIIPIEQWARRRIQEDDYLLIAPRVGGPGAATVVSFLFWTGVKIAIYTGIAYGIGQLINSLSSKPKKPSRGFDEAELSQSFGWNPATLQRQGLPVPRFYGLNKMHGNIIAAHTEITGATTNLVRQYALVSLGIGPFRDVVIDGTMKLNAQQAENFDDVFYESRRGNLRQARISYFDKTLFPKAPQRLVVNGSPIIYETTNANFNNLEIDLAFPRGLYDATGPALANNTVNQTIEVKKTTASVWQELVTGDITDDTTDKVIRTYKTEGTINIEYGSNYQIRVIKNTAERDSASYGDDLFLDRVREVIDEPFTYPRRALVGLKALATDQLSGTLRFSCYSRCLYVRTYDGSSWSIEYSNNPAWVIHDILTQPVYSGSHSPWLDLKLMLNFNGADEATSTVDESPRGHTVNFTGTAQLDTATKKFETASLLLDGNSDDVHLDDSNDWNFLENIVDDWIIDFFVKHTDHVGKEIYFSQYEDVNNRWALYHTHGLGMSIEAWIAGVNVIGSTFAAGEITDTNWHHIALIKVGAEIGMYLDGTQIGYVLMTSAKVGTFTSDYFIGQDGNSASWHDGNFDHFRIIKRNILNAAPNSTPDDTITPPTEEYTDPGNSYSVERYDGYDPSKLNASDFKDLADWCEAAQVNPVNFTISSISLAVNAVIGTTSKHGRSVGDIVLFRGVDQHGMVELTDGTTATVIKVTDDQTFTTDLDTSGYTAFDTGSWLGIDSSHLMAGGAGVAFCGEEISAHLDDALDGTDRWDHNVNENHWFILDLGHTLNVQKVRGRSEMTDDPIDIDIFVSNDTGAWGAAVASGIATWQDTVSWVEIDTTDKEGRYVKVEIIDTEDANRDLSFGTGPNYPIIDVYAGQSTATVEEYKPRFTFNGGFDIESNMWDAAISVCELCRSMIYWKGDQISVTIDKSATAVYAYTVGDIIKDSFKVTYLPLADRASEIEAHYRNARNDYERQPFTLYNGDIGNPTQKVRLDLFGVTDADMAERLVNYKLLMNKLLKKRVNFAAEIDAIGNTIGDVVKVQSDVTNWGRIGSGDEHYTGGGRIVQAEISGTDTVITIAGEIKFDDAIWRGGATTYKMMVQTADDIPPETKTISGFTESSVPGGNYDITVTGTFTTLPVREDKWAAGVENLETKDFRITNMKQSDQKRIEIEAIEYVEAVYADD